MSGRGHRLCALSNQVSVITTVVSSTLTLAKET
jgi:hypothetical protein